MIFPRNYKHIPNLAAILALSSVLLAGCHQAPSNAAAPRPALTYKITTNSGVDSDVYAGEIRARIETDHAFRLGGKVSQRLVDTGAVVRRGQPLATLDPQDVKLSVDAANAQVLAQQTDADFALAELNRFKDLFAKGFVSQSALDQKLSVANTAKAKLDSARAQANVTVNQAGYATLVAETDGVVTQVTVEAGQVVAAGQPIIRIANPREKELATNAPESRLNDFRRAQDKSAPRELRIATWNQPEKYYRARIREIGGAADVITRTYPVRITLVDADDAIQLGMSAFAVFIGANAPDNIAVPLSAIYVNGEKTGVWQVASDGKVSLKAVAVVQYRETSALVKALNGSIKPGDVIIAAGVHKLREGEVVKPITDPQITGDGKVARVPLVPETTKAGSPQKGEVALLQRLFSQSAQ